MARLWCVADSVSSRPPQWRPLNIEGSASSALQACASTWDTTSRPLPRSSLERR
jgi:hypothetical protein